MSYTPMGIIALARQNKFFRAAVESNDDYLRLVGLRNKVVEAQRQLAPPESPRTPSSAHDDLDDWLSAVAHASEVERQHVAKATALTALRNQVEAQIVSSLDPDRILTELHQQMDSLMARVAAVGDRLDGASTPAAAIAGGVADAWRELTALRPEYDQLRVAQRAVMVGQPDYLMSSKTVNYADELCSDTALKNLDVVFPEWKFPTAHNLDGSVIERRPWPLDDPVAELLWLSQSPAEPWIPTLRQLDQLHAQRQRDSVDTVKTTDIVRDAIPKPARIQRLRAGGY